MYLALGWEGSPSALPLTLPILLFAPYLGPSHSAMVLDSNSSTQQPLTSVLLGSLRILYALKVSQADSAFQVATYIV